MAKLNGPLAAGGRVAEDYRVNPVGTRVAYVADQETDEVFELFVTQEEGTLEIPSSAALDGWVSIGSAFGQYWWWLNVPCAHWPVSPDRYENCPCALVVPLSPDEVA